MEVTTIIYIAIAFVIGIVVTYFFRKGDSSNSTQLSELNTENESLKLKLAEAEANSSSKANAIKAKYESLLKETNAQVSKLDQQLKSALDGKLDDSIKDQLANTEKLKKKIKDLEDELEEAEDDLSDAKKKLKTKDSDIADLQDNLIREQKTAKGLREELSSVKQLLEDKLAELQLKMGSLEFIQEILSAKEICTSDTNKLYKNIDFFESFVKGQFTDLNSYLYSTYKLTWNNIEGNAGFEEKRKYFFNSFDQWASTKWKSWLDGKTTIAFVGEFSAGKTSIVNRILSQDNPNIPQLPVSTKATTAIPTYIAGGSTVSYSFISGDAKRKTILEDTFKKVSKDILDQVKGVS